MKRASPRAQFLVATILCLSGCIPLGPDHAIWLIPEGENPAKKMDLAKTPLGIHVTTFSNESGTLAYTDITVRNNSGSQLSKVTVEVLWFQDAVQVADLTVVFDAVEEGDEEYVQKRTRVDGYLWNDWTYSYKIE